MTTETLIDRLAHELSPVRPLERPGVRAVRWLVGAGLYLGAVAWLLTSTADVDANGAAWRFVGPQLLAVVTGIVAAAAAFASVVPGVSSRLVMAGPLAAVLAWGVSLAAGSSGWTDAGRLASASHEPLCVATILLSGIPLLLALSWMLRRGAPLHPSVTAALAALAVGALANIGACVSAPHTDNLVTLVWHGATVAALVAAAAALGPRVLRWQHAGRDR